MLKIYDSPTKQMSRVRLLNVWKCQIEIKGYTCYACGYAEMGFIKFENKIREIK